jgi:hypothetical protein
MKYVCKTQMRKINLLKIYIVKSIFGCYNVKNTRHLALYSQEAL